VYWLAWCITEDNEDAEDVLQQTFLKADSDYAKSQQNESAVMRLVRIAVNQSFAKLRHRNASKLLRLSLEAEVDGVFAPQEIVDWGDDAEKRYTGEELRRMVHEGVQSLTPFSRVVFILRDVAHLKPEEIADLFRLSVPRVKSHLLRSRLQLREHLGKYFGPNLKEKAPTA
jgi:RNA polymerase sigma-70 factor (ECF subfamily)